jgi:site-specific recombinase XerD
LKKLNALDVPGKTHAQRYLCHKYRRNLKANTLRSNYTGIVLFLLFLKKAGRDQIENVSRRDLEAFVEHEQDRGLKSATVRNRLESIKVFIGYLIGKRIVSSEVLSQKLSVKVPQSLPRALNPFDVKRLLNVLDNVRDRAMILVLLRTGMRIGELLSCKVMDVNFADKKILIFEGEKNRIGRAVCLSDDACHALKDWFYHRDLNKEKLFYSQYRQAMSYSAASAMFKKYLNIAGLSHKGYSLHCLRHTFATDLLNAGMRLECLQQLLGHSSLEMTLRYARLTDRTREQEYYKAMAIIEKEQPNELDRFDHQLPQIFETEKLFATHT